MPELGWNTTIKRDCPFLESFRAYLADSSHNKTPNNISTLVFMAGRFILVSQRAFLRLFSTVF